MNFGGNNIQKMMKQAQKMQQDMLKAQENLHNIEVEGVSGGGMVKVKMSAASDVLDVQINPEVVDPDDIEMLQDLVLAAIKDALAQANATASAEMSKVTGGMNLGIPGL